jgi:histidinol-phosphate aminotransferase
MSSWLEGRLKELEAIAGYRAADPVSEVVARFGLKVDEVVKLDSNENLVLPYTFLRRLLLEVASSLDPRLYPVAPVQRLYLALAEHLGVGEESIVVGYGSDQLIDLLIGALARGGRVVSIKPSFTYYPYRCASFGVPYQALDLHPDFSLPTDTLIEAATAETLLFIPSPNNPTGNQFPRDEIVRLLEEGAALVVVDEAYAEFADYSLVQEAQEHERLVVLRTFSKAFGMAGLRLGYLVANPHLAGVLKSRVQQPFPAGAFSALLAARLLEEYEEVRASVQEVKRERQRLIEALHALEGVEVFPSQANFLLLNTRLGVEELWAGLAQQGVLVRRVGRVLEHENCVRVTVGTYDMNRRLLAALAKVLKEG